MKVYQNYKDSGSEIIKAIPTHWGIAPLKFIGNIILGKMLTPQDKGGYIEKPYLRAKNIGWETVDDEDINTMWFSQYEIEQYRLKQNDLLISEGGEVGRTAIWNNELEECYIQNSVHKVTINQGHNPRYYLYHSQVFGKTGYYDSIVNRVSIGHLTGEKLKDIRFVVPPLPEQQAIADFLDRKTAQIDTLIEKKQRQIDLLQEQRTALINHAVTKGLNPDVRMKDSGVEWLGEIPSHWKIKPLKHIKAEEGNSFVDGPFGSNLKTIHFIDNGDVYVIESGFVTTGQFVSGEYKTISREHFETIRRSECKAGDIIIAKIGARFGTSGILPELGKPCVVSGNSLKLTVNVLENSTEFIHFSLLSLKRVGAAFELIVNATAQPALSLGRMNEMKLAVPPKHEQDEIAQYIYSVSKKINETEDRINRHIDLIQEYRTALISEAVTGKIDVRTS